MNFGDADARLLSSQEGRLKLGSVPWCQLGRKCPAAQGAAKGEAAAGSLLPVLPG